jgi:hypothetical protein
MGKEKIIEITAEEGEHCYRIAIGTLASNFCSEYALKKKRGRKCSVRQGDDFIKKCCDCWHKSIYATIKDKK